MQEKKKRSCKHYTAEFKKEAVARYKQLGLTKTCKELGISTSTLHQWKKAFLYEEVDSSNIKPTYEELEKQVRHLKKELGYVEEINRVLKKSTAIFSSKEMGGLK